MFKVSEYDVAIIGGGAAGASAAIYSKRKGLKTVLITENIGGQILTTSEVENYLGFELIGGVALSEEFKKHIEKLEIEVIEFNKVEKIEDKGIRKLLFLEDESVIETKAVILATGSKHRELGVKGEAEFAGRGVAYCATCDGPFYAGRDVVICGGGNSAIESAIDLAKIAKSVTIVHRSQFRADDVTVKLLADYENITTYVETQVEEIYGENHTKGLKATIKATGETIDIKADGIFIEIGMIPNSSLVTDLVNINPRNEVIIDSQCKTSAQGIFAAGDVTDVPYKQIIVAAGEGAKAALSANTYINSLL